MQAMSDPSPRGRSGGHVLTLFALLALGLLVLALSVGGCAKYNTYYNAKTAMDEAEQVREDRIKAGEDVTKPSGNQKRDYEKAITKAQKILDEYPGHGLTDDALFLQAKAYHRINSYRSSIGKLNLLFTNFPATPYMEESVYIQALNYLLLGNLIESQNYLDRLERSYPDSKYQSEVLKVSGENSYALEEWEAATEAFTAYIEKFPEAEAHDDIAYKLAWSLWELEEYAEAEPLLLELEKTDSSQDLAFRARLLLARVLVRMGEADAADELIGRLRTEAEIFQSQGEVALVEAEAYVARGRDDQAAAVLENMPEEWSTSDLKPRAAEMLGYIYLRRGQWEEARDAFQQAVRGKRLLEYPEDTPLKLKTLQDFLAAEQSLVDAEPERVASLKLLQANAMLFGFDRPREAADLYLEVVRTEEADSTVAARGLYGAAMVYRNYLDNADSAAVLAAELQERYPESAQAYQLNAGSRANLLAYLLEQQQLEREAALASGDLDAVIAAAGLDGTGSQPGMTAVPTSGMRRRMVYFQRKDNLVFPAPQASYEIMPTAAFLAIQPDGVVDQFAIPVTNEQIADQAVEDLLDDQQTVQQMGGEALADTTSNQAEPEPKVEPKAEPKAPPKTFSEFGG